jgi:tRNA(adenine34) deaminase
MTHQYYMQLAYKEARIAFEEGEIPVGAVIVSPVGLVAKSHNQVERLKDVTAHAELLALTAAANDLGAKYLQQCTLYVTLEPCMMCAGACYWSQLKRLVYAASDNRRGFSNYQHALKDTSLQVLHPKTEVLSGILEQECSLLLKDFFLTLRN